MQDKEGKQPTPMPKNWDRDEYGARIRAKLAGQDAIPAPAGYQLFAPIIDQFLKEHLLADIFCRDNLGHLERELTTIAALAAMPGLESQLRFHLAAVMNVGMTPKQLREFVSVLDEKIGQQQAQAANTALDAVLASRKK